MSMREKRNAKRILVANVEERGHLDDLGIDGRVILKWILRNIDKLDSCGTD